jgi:hypothetical protein
MRPPDERPGAAAGAGPVQKSGIAKPTNHPKPTTGGRHGDTFDTAAPPHRRRAAALRLPPLGPCSCVRDPEHDRHRCRGELTDNMVDGYRDAVIHLRDLGLPAAPLLPEIRVLWRRGPAERRLVAEITERWELAG